MYYRAFLSPGAWETKQTEHGACVQTVTGLPANTKFVVEVLASSDSVQGSFGYDNYVITKTKMTSDHDVPRKTESMSTCNIPYPYEEYDNELKIRKIRIGMILMTEKHTFLDLLFIHEQ